MFGRAGLQTYYKREMVNSIGFVIFDTVKWTARVEGVSRANHAPAFFILFTRVRQPFGNGNHSNEGTPFYSSDVFAFGSFAQPDPSAHREFILNCG